MEVNLMHTLVLPKRAAFNILLAVSFLPDGILQVSLKTVLAPSGNIAVSKFGQRRNGKAVAIAV